MNTSILRPHTCPVCRMDTLLVARQGNKTFVACEDGCPAEQVRSSVPVSWRAKSMALSLQNAVAQVSNHVSVVIDGNGGAPYDDVKSLVVEWGDLDQDRSVDASTGAPSEAEHAAKVEESLGSAAANYAADGICVIPLATNSKAPIEKGWQRIDRRSPAEITELWKQNPACNVGHIPGKAERPIVEVDIDGADAKQKAIEYGLYAEPTRTIKTPRDGERLQFICPEEIRDESKIELWSQSSQHVDREKDEIVLRVNLNCVLPPSVWNGKTYTYLDPDEKFRPLPQRALDAALKKLGRHDGGDDRKQETAQRVRKREPHAARAKKISDALSGLSNERAASYDSAVQVGMAIHAELPDDTGLQLFDEFCRRCPEQYERDREWPSKKWGTFSEAGNSSGKLGLGSLIRWAKEDGTPADDVVEVVVTQRPPAPARAEAFHGPLGNFAQNVARESEADPHAVLAQGLVYFGAIVGRGPHVQLGGSAPQRANEYAVIVGPTGVGRKGTALSHVKHLIKHSGVAVKIGSGLQSGEGLIHHVRDAEEESGRRGRAPDRGISDKRLLVVETEFAGALSVMKRDTATLSPVLRDAWDGEDLRNLSKNSPERATAAHIAVIGHITLADLRDKLNDTEKANGFGNRFMYVYSCRSQLRPFGGLDPDDELYRSFGRHFQSAVEAASQVHRVDFTAKARERWARVYAELSAERPGLVGALTHRAEAHVVRLALIYSLLDLHSQIDVVHLNAALAFWSYCEDTVRCLFQDQMGDPWLERALDKLHDAGDQGVTDTEFYEASGKHKSGRWTSEQLVALGFGVREKLTSEGKGRPAYRTVLNREHTQTTHITQGDIPQDADPAAPEQERRA